MDLESTIVYESIREEMDSVSLCVLFGFLFYLLLKRRSDFQEHILKADNSINVSEASLMSSFCIFFLLVLKELKSISQFFVLLRQLFDFLMDFG